jgi:hypothetical protein
MTENIIDAGSIQMQPRKTGPKPKEMVTAEYLGIPVGRDKVVVAPEEVKDLASIGCTNRDISNWFGINEDTLVYNFKPELIKGREDLKVSLRRAQLKLALQGNATMLIWLGKNLLGQSDNPVDSSANQPLPWADD